MRIVAACLLPATLLGCASIQTRMTETTAEAAVTVDSRIELMGVIQLLSDYFLVSYLDSSYKLEAAEYFASCRDHPAVSKFTELSSSDFSFSTVPDAFIALSEPPLLEQRYPPKPEVTQSAGGPEAYAEFLSLTRAFASDCGFPEFYARNRPYYDRLIAHLARRSLPRPVSFRPISVCRWARPKSSLVRCFMMEGLRRVMIATMEKRLPTRLSDLPASSTAKRTLVRPNDFNP